MSEKRKLSSDEELTQGNLKPESKKVKSEDSGTGDPDNGSSSELSLHQKENASKETPTSATLSSKISDASDRNNSESETLDDVALPISEREQEEANASISTGAEQSSMVSEDADINVSAVTTSCDFSLNQSQKEDNSSEETETNSSDKANGSLSTDKNAAHLTNSSGSSGVSLQESNDASDKQRSVSHEESSDLKECSIGETYEKKLNQDNKLQESNSQDSESNLTEDDKLPLKILESDHSDDSSSMPPPSKRKKNEDSGEVISPQKKQLKLNLNPGESSDNSIPNPSLFNNELLLTSSRPNEKKENPENDTIAEKETGKKKRVRVRHIINKIQAQLEFYFSRANIAKDNFMKELLKQDCYVPLKTFLSFKKISDLTSDVKLIQFAAKNSSVLKLSQDYKSVCTTLNINPKEDELDCTIYIDNLSLLHTFDWIQSHFSKYGRIEYISYPKYKASDTTRGFAFVEYDCPESATKALNAFAYWSGQTGVARDSLFSDSLCENYPSEFKFSLQSQINCPDPNNFPFMWEGLNESDHLPPDQPVSCQAEQFEMDESEENSGGKDSKDADIEAVDSSEQVQKKKRKKKLHRRNKLKLKQKKHRQHIKDGCRDGGCPLPLRVLSKRDFLKQKESYLQQQKEALGTCKRIMNKFKEEKSKTNEPASELPPKAPNKKPEKVLGTVVKITLDKPLQDKLQMKDLIMKFSKDVVYVDARAGESVIHVRFRTPESANSFLQDSVWNARSSLLIWEDEDNYWEKIQQSYDKMKSFSAVKKKGNRRRGKQRLMERWRKFQEPRNSALGEEQQHEQTNEQPQL